MRIGTISMNINSFECNYGAFLHIWAFQHYLKSLKEVEYTEFIDYTTPVLEWQNENHPLRSLLRKSDIKKTLWLLKRLNIYHKRLEKIKDFRAKHLQISKEAYTQKTLNSANLDYYYVICESDIIWSPRFTGGHFDKSFFLALDSMKKMKKIAYAPSMSDGKMTHEQEQELKELINYPDTISCRDAHGKRILERFTDKEVAHVLDPVLLLDATDYDCICAKPIIDSPYLLLYLPNGDNKTLRENANEYAKTHRLRILEISTKLVSFENDSTVCLGSAGIEEFLSAIRYATIVFTNSFHGICFSIIFNVQFYAFSRKHPEKIIDICNTFELSERYYPNGKFIQESEIDYNKVNYIWKKKQSDSQRWLTKALTV